MLVGRARRDARERGRELPLRPPRAGRRRSCCAPTSASRRASCPLLEVDGEIVSSSHIRGLVAGGAVEYAGPAARRAVHRSTARSSTATSAGATLGFPTANLVPRDGFVLPGHGVYACRARTPTATWHARGGRTSACGRSSRPAAASSIEAFLIDFDGRPLRPAAAARVPQAPARGEALRQRRGARRADGAATSTARPRRERGLTAATLLRRMSTLTQERKQRDRRAVRRERRRTRATPASRSRCSRSGSTTSPSTCASTRRTTTRAVACSCSSASAAGC